MSPARRAVNPWLIALSVILPTFMEVLDTSIASVALPYIAGRVSATTDEATWVLTSYLANVQINRTFPFASLRVQMHNSFLVVDLLQPLRYCWPVSLQKVQSGGRSYVASISSEGIACRALVLWQIRIRYALCCQRRNDPGPVESFSTMIGTCNDNAP